MSPTEPPPRLGAAADRVLMVGHLLEYRPGVRALETLRSSLDDAPRARG